MWVTDSEDTDSEGNDSEDMTELLESEQMVAVKKNSEFQEVLQCDLRGHGLDRSVKREELRQGRHNVPQMQKKGPSRFRAMRYMRALWS